MDSTHGTNQYGYLLTTVMVCDDNHEGLPVAICYSNRVCSIIHEPFFEEIRNRLTHLQPKVFMSDDDPAFWNAWQRVFGDVIYNLLCSWHVSRSWNRNLSSKVKDPELRKEMKNKLTTLVSEIDESTFERIYDDFGWRNYTKMVTKMLLEYFMLKIIWRKCKKILLGHTATELDVE
ncbi:putative zinc finger transcription factor protein 17 [Trichonephila clavipes]|nr:putative zinc finger transcription factor protein 17 [Trichonephila clavipes]